MVLTGNPKSEQINTISEVDSMAPKPWIGFILKSFMPMVFMIRFPPVSMPSERASEQARMTHIGTTKAPPVPGV